jgi:hypothetical protein
MSSEPRSVRTAVFGGRCATETCMGERHFPDGGRAG